VGDYKRLRAQNGTSLVHAVNKRYKHRKKSGEYEMDTRTTYVASVIGW